MKKQILNTVISVLLCCILIGCSTSNPFAPGDDNVTGVSGLAEDVTEVAADDVATETDTQDIDEQSDDPGTEVLGTEVLPDVSDPESDEYCDDLFSLSFTAGDMEYDIDSCYFLFDIDTYSDSGDRYLSYEGSCTGGKLDELNVSDSSEPFDDDFVACNSMEDGVRDKFSGILPAGDGFEVYNTDPVVENGTGGFLLDRYELQDDGSVKADLYVVNLLSDGGISCVNGQHFVYELDDTGDVVINGDLYEEVLSWTTAVYDISLVES